MRILQNHRNAAAQGIAGVVADGDTVNQNFALLNVVEAVEQIGDGRLAGTGGTDECDLLTGLCRQCDIAQNDLVGIVAEGDVVQYNAAGCICGHTLCTLTVGFFLRLIHDGKDALCTGKCGEDRCHLPGDHVDGHGELTGVVDKDNKTADVKASRKTQKTADACCQRVGDLGSVAHDRTHDTAPELRLELLVAHIVVQCRKFLDADIFMIEDLDDLLTCDGFLDIAVDRTERRLLTGIVFCGQLGNGTAALGKDRDEDNGDDRQPDVGVQHHAERTDKVDNAGDHTGQRVVDHHINGVDVVGKA